MAASRYAPVDGYVKCYSESTVPVLMHTVHDAYGDYVIDQQTYMYVILYTAMQQD